MHNFQKLVIWQEAMDIVHTVYVATRAFPKEEVYGLVSQMQRAAVSIPSNIAEGAGRNSDKEFANFLGIAQGSSFELQTQVLLAKRLGYMSEAACDQLVKQLQSLQPQITSMKQKLESPTTK